MLQFSCLTCVYGSDGVDIYGFTLNHTEVFFRPFYVHFVLELVQESN